MTSEERQDKSDWVWELCDDGGPSNVPAYLLVGKGGR